MNSRPAPASTTTAGTVRVWDPVVRLFHWTVVGGCLINLLRDDGDKLHQWVGYVVAGAVLVRLIWGFAGSGHARFAAFVPRPAALRGYLVQLMRGREARYLGHNPAGATMMVALIGLLAAVSLSGWMMGLDRFWGNELLQELHELFANSILVLAVIHVAAAIFESVRHRENLSLCMINGRKRKAGGSDIDDAPDTD